MASGDVANSCSMAQVVGSPNAATRTGPAAGQAGVRYMAPLYQWPQAAHLGVLAGIGQIVR